MKFSQFLWSNFLETERGKTLVDFFSNYNANIKNQMGLDTFRGILQSIGFEISMFDDQIIKERFERILFNSELLQKSIIEEPGFSMDIRDFDSFEKLYKELLSWTIEGDDKNLMPLFDIDDIQDLSEELYFLFPEYCFPYYYTFLYFMLKAIIEEFGVFPPAVPKKADNEERMLHYLELCRSLYDFRVRFGMTEHELPAFLYGFAVEVACKHELSDELPAPRKAYFVGGGKNAEGIDASVDYSFLDTAVSTTITRWQGNVNTQPGDIIVMYCLSPRSCIHSIWRAVTPGFVDPFFGFYNTIYMGMPITVEPITLKELKTDEVLSQMPLVRANMQGINGREINKAFYDRILMLLEQKGTSLEALPLLAEGHAPDTALFSERDVEQKKLEPLLKELGYDESDWKRQVQIRAGRGRRVVADYVVFPRGDGDDVSGHWLWEAKLTIPNNKQLKEDFGQALSYALLLRCKGLGLASEQGVWLSEHPFVFEELNFWSWKQIKEHDVFNDVFNITGNKKRL